MVDEAHMFAWIGVDSWGEFGWVVFGLFGQILFAGRFIVQWIASEKARRSVVPVVFWYFSIGGGAVLFSYALWRGDPVFILGQSLGLFIYSRNLWLIHVEKRASRSDA